MDCLIVQHFVFSCIYCVGSITRSCQTIKSDAYDIQSSQDMSRPSLAQCRLEICCNTLTMEYMLHIDIMLKTFCVEIDTETV